MKQAGAKSLLLCVVVVVISVGCLPPTFDPPDDPGAGEPEPVPEIAVLVDGWWIETGSEFDAGTIVVLTSVLIEISIENHGSSALHLSGLPCISIAGTNADQISIVTEPETTVQPGGTTAVEISASAPAAGLVSAEVTIESDDPDESAFTFSIVGTGVEPPARLPRTGQTNSLATGDDGDLETGVQWPSLRFVDNGNETTTDTLTGLMWETTPSSSSYTWDAAVHRGNTRDLASHTDWRLPNVSELMSLLNAEASNPAAWLNGHDEISGVVADDYWTSTTCYEYPTRWAWVVHFDSGVLARVNVSAIPSGLVWVCRDAGEGVVALPRTGMIALYATGDDGDLEAGVPWPSPRFVDCGDDTVADALTGLVWAREISSSTLNWASALSYADSLTIGGHTDWRLPNRHELRSLVSYGTTTNHYRLSGEFSMTVPDGEYWSSSTYAQDTASGWVVVMETGHSYYEAKTAANHVWAVRGGD